MFLVINKSHEKAQSFLDYVKKVAPDAKIRDYATSIYIDTEGVRVINFLSHVFHDVVVMEKDQNGELLSFPIELFGTIYEF